jgi:hypothetical protein
MFTSCSRYTIESVSNTYSTKGGFEWGSRIELKNDSTFTYEWQVGLVMGRTSGKWFIDRNKLILNSDFQPQQDTIPNYRLITRRNASTNEIILDLLKPKNKQPLFGAYGLMYYNGDIIDQQTSYNNGRLVFKKQLSDSILIIFPSQNLKEIVLKNINPGYYKIETIEKSIYNHEYEFFTNEIWKIRNKYLIDKTKNKYYYEKRFFKVE